MSALQHVRWGAMGVAGGWDAGGRRRMRNRPRAEGGARASPAVTRRTPGGGAGTAGRTPP
eukprot:CAMPEP_0174351812 /NCGR_PEP_ID=MMETSP0811_2-20130205/9301_1 /TAXON_ID=73025 ORGANISM="Eutreptiella gymnastica-like, Strain CCMP1594" /NCGR_SAMPLE_ID=MMETSP0811_2 /ASSEMBLY_ACC=CAM_ASM_000667 /LENGTH=59 /DNA_ID=CAMNT_0015481417 /DNA_START=120 /DNA_END=296 /DNA_ORIENTATION=-